MSKGTLLKELTFDNIASKMTKKYGGLDVVFKKTASMMAYHAGYGAIVGGVYGAATGDPLGRAKEGAMMGGLVGMGRAGYRGYKGMGFGMKSAGEITARGVTRNIGSATQEVGATLGASRIGGGTVSQGIFDFGGVSSGRYTSPWRVPGQKSFNFRQESAVRSTPGQGNLFSTTRAGGDSLPIGKLNIYSRRAEPIPVSKLKPTVPQRPINSSPYRDASGKFARRPGQGELRF